MTSNDGEEESLTRLKGTGTDRDIESNKTMKRIFIVKKLVKKMVILNYRKKFRVK